MVKRNCPKRCFGITLLIKIITVSNLIFTSHFVSNSKTSDNVFEKIHVFDDDSQVGKSIKMSQNKSVILLEYF